MVSVLGDIDSDHAERRAAMGNHLRWFRCPSRWHDMPLVFVAAAVSGLAGGMYMFYMACFSSNPAQALPDVQGMKEARLIVTAAAALTASQGVLILLRRPAALYLFWLWVVSWFGLSSYGMWHRTEWDLGYLAGEGAFCAGICGLGWLGRGWLRGHQRDGRRSWPIGRGRQHSDAPTQRD